tara:strand:- start:910 stop:1059 length:150 start_codon:yes stop_codon:yes gene_type:complete
LLFNFGIVGGNLSKKKEKKTNKKKNEMSISFPKYRYIKKKLIASIDLQK